MHCRRRISGTAGRGCATRVPPATLEEVRRLAAQTRHGSAHTTSASRPLSLFIVEHIHRRPLHRHILHQMIASCSPDWLAMHCRTGLLKNRKRTTRTHRRQYTPLSWTEALQLIGLHPPWPSVHPYTDAFYFRLVVHVSRGHIAVCPPVYTTPVCGWHLIVIGRLTPLPMFMHAFTEAWGDEAAEKNIYREAVKNGTVRSLTIYAVLVVYGRCITIDS